MHINKRIASILVVCFMLSACEGSKKAPVVTPPDNLAEDPMDPPPPPPDDDDELSDESTDQTPALSDDNNAITETDVTPPIDVLPESDTTSETAAF